MEDSGATLMEKCENQVPCFQSSVALVLSTYLHLIPMECKILQ